MTKNKGLSTRATPVIISPCNIVLGGGGMKGFGHCGFLQAAEELGIEYNHIFGISIGSVISTFYSNGYSTSDISEILYKEIADFRRHVLSQLFRWQSAKSLFQHLGIIDLKPLFTKMVDEYKLKPNDKLSIIASHWASRKPIRFTGTNYDLATAITASSAAPAFMQAVHYHQPGKTAMKLVDGGVHHPTTVDFCQGAAIVSRVGRVTRLPSERLSLLDLIIHTGEMLLVPILSCMQSDVSQKHLVVKSGRPDVATMTFGVSQNMCKKMIEYGYQIAKHDLTQAINAGHLSHA